MALFPARKLNDLIALAGELMGNTYANVRRQNHFNGISATLAASLPVTQTPSDQLYSDLMALNNSVRAAGAESVHPLMMWVENSQIVNDAHERSDELAAFLLIPGAADAGQNREAVFDAYRDVWDTRPLLNRSRLRDWLRRRVQNTGVPVVSVQGEPRSGKSVSAEFARLVAATYGLEVIEVDVRQVALEQFEPDDLADMIAAQLAVDAPVPRRKDYASATRWVTQVQLWLIRHLGSLAGSAWLVLDHFDDDNVREDTKQLIRQLEKPSLTGKIPPLIVLGYEPPNGAGKLGATVVRDPVSRLGRPDVSAYYERRVRAELPDASEGHRSQLVQSYTDTVFEGLDPNYTAEELVDAIREVDQDVAVGVPS